MYTFTSRWLGLPKWIQTMVENCATCEKERKPRPEPDYPWQKVAMDLFDCHRQQYLLVVDYFSRYIKLAYLSSSTSSETIIANCRSLFARHDTPETVKTDNGPQFTSHWVVKFVNEYGFSHETSSPHYPQANGEAERAVQTVKNKC